MNGQNIFIQLSNPKSCVVWEWKYTSCIPAQNGSSGALHATCLIALHVGACRTLTSHVLRGSFGARDEPLRTSAWEANRILNVEYMYLIKQLTPWEISCINKVLIKRCSAWNKRNEPLGHHVFLFCYFRWSLERNKYYRKIWNHLFFFSILWCSN